MKRSAQSVVLFVTGLLIAAAPLAAEVRLASPFSDNMVLQRDMKVPVWGWAEPGEKVTVSVMAPQQAATKEFSATADKDGKWLVRLDPTAAGGPFEMTVKGKNTITLKNVLFGEVWICGGQSNMALSVVSAKNSAKEIPAANYPNIRLMSVPMTPADEPQATCSGSWVVCTPETVREFSAAGYYFGRMIHKDLGVPVGLINSCYGGTPIETWMSKAALTSDPDFKMVYDHWDHVFRQVNLNIEIYESEKKDVEVLNRAAAAGGYTGAAKMEEPVMPKKFPSRLYNGMIAPLAPYGIGGFLWYQGEANADHFAPLYRKLFPALITSWRQAWGQGDLPFIYVQIANWTERHGSPVESDWAVLREAQRLTLALPKTGMAVAIDQGDADDIHPKDKQETGRRLALAAEAVAYGKSLVYSGPLYDSLTGEGSQLRLKFKSVGGGLVTKPLEPSSGTWQLVFASPDHRDVELELKSSGATTEPTGFALAGADRKFFWAEAQIDGDTVVVHSDKVKEPKFVRYAWANNPACNLYNKEGLPASPFEATAEAAKGADKR
jgi:sialate O-acetylesterase